MPELWAQAAARLAGGARVPEGPGAANPELTTSNSQGRRGAGEGRGESPQAPSWYVGGLSAHTPENASFHFIVFITEEQKALGAI